MKNIEKNTKKNIKKKLIHAFQTNSSNLVNLLYKTDQDLCFEIYIECVIKGDRNLIELFYKHDLKINPSLTLHIALQFGHTDIVSFIIEDYKHNYGTFETGSICVHDSALIEVCRQGNLSLYNCLLKYGSPNPSSFFKCIQIAEENGHFDLANQLRQEQKKLDGPFDDHSGPCGHRGDQGCKGSHSMCICTNKFWSEEIEAIICKYGSDL